MARRLRFFKEQMKKAGLSPSATSTMSNDIDLDHLEVVWEVDLLFWVFLFFEPIVFYVDQLLFFGVCFQVKLGELEADLLEMNTNNEQLQRTYSELLEYKLVLQKVWLAVVCVLCTYMIRNFVSVRILTLSLVLAVYSFIG